MILRKRQVDAAPPGPPADRAVRLHVWMGADRTRLRPPSPTAVSARRGSSTPKFVFQTYNTPLRYTGGRYTFRSRPAQ